MADGKEKERKAEARPSHSREEKIHPELQHISMSDTSECCEPAFIEVSSGNPAIPSCKLNGTIQARQRKTLTVLTDQEIAVSAAVRVQSKDVLALGEVLRCTREPDAMWTVAVNVRHSMFIV